MSSVLAVWVCALAGAAPARGDEVAQAMRGNLAALVALQPLLQDPDAFADPANQKTIKASLAVLGRTRHRFARPKAQEPAAALAVLFAEEISRAQVDLAAGRPQSARSRLRASTGMCLSCHARQLSPHDYAASGRAADGAGLPALERASFLATTRQFDAALALWGDTLSRPPKDDAEAFAHTQAFRSALSVAIRAKDDPAAAIGLLETRCGAPWLSPMARRSCVRQLNDAKSWAAEQLSTPAPTTGTALYTRASELVDFSEVAQTLYPREDERVKLLRATAYLSLALEREPSAPWRGEALWLLGLATGATLDPELWPLDGIYLEACVRENPHTALAQRCVERLAERTLFDYTGSGGTRLPWDVAQRLEAMRALAK